MSTLEAQRNAAQIVRVMRRNVEAAENALSRAAASQALLDRIKPKLTGAVRETVTREANELGRRLGVAVLSVIDCAQGSEVQG